MMTEIPYAKDVKGWLAIANDVEEINEDIASVARDSLSRVCVFLGEKATLECSQEVAKMAVSGFKSDNVRVRYEALHCTGLLLNDLAPHF